MSTILFAIGNNGRQDDGLGWAFGEVLERSGFEGEVHYRYQLHIEDAELISKVEKVIFVDAFRDVIPDGFQFHKLTPAAEFHFSTHSLPPQSVLYLSQVLYGAQPEAWCLLIQGEAWELELGLSPRATENLAKAVSYFVAQHRFAAQH